MSTTPRKGVDIENAPAGVPELHDDPNRPVVEDKAEEATDFAEEIEREVESAAASGFLGGPMAWGMIALAVLVAILAIAMS